MALKWPIMCWCAPKKLLTHYCLWMFLDAACDSTFPGDNDSTVDSSRQVSLVKDNWHWRCSGGCGTRPVCLLQKGVMLTFLNHACFTEYCNVVRLTRILWPYHSEIPSWLFVPMIWTLCLITVCIINVCIYWLIDDIMTEHTWFL